METLVSKGSVFGSLSSLQITFPSFISIFILSMIDDRFPLSSTWQTPRFTVPLSDKVFTIILKIRTNNEDNFTKARPDSVINRIIHNCFTTGAKALHLLHTPVAGSHARR